MVIQKPHQSELSSIWK